MPDSSGKRSDHRFVSGDILAYQAKDLGTYYLDFTGVGKDSDVYKYINEPKLYRQPWRRLQYSEYDSSGYGQDLL